jgi:uncharacterized protein involved in type VI secretion and phage assembly
MADLDLLGLLNGRVGLLRSELDKTESRVLGVTLGVVTDLNDPRHLGRVKVKLPWLSETVESAWAQIATAWAGQQRGSYLIPEVDDEVVVAFRHGDLRYPIVLGFVWSDTSRPPEVDPAVQRRELRSRSGHALIFQDLLANEKVVLQSQAGHTVSLDDSAGGAKITIADSTGVLSIVLDTVNLSITINASSGNLSLNAPAGKLSLQAASIDINATGPVTVQGGANVAVKGPIVQIN